MNKTQYELVENKVFNKIKDKLNDISLFLSKNDYEIGDLSISRNGIEKVNNVLILKRFLKL